MPKIRYRLATPEEIDQLPEMTNSLGPVFVGTHYNEIVTYGICHHPIILIATKERYGNLGIEDDLVSFVNRVLS
jgi:hypothetical protein